MKGRKITMIPSCGQELYYFKDCPLLQSDPNLGSVCLSLN